MMRTLIKLWERFSWLTARLSCGLEGRSARVVMVIPGESRRLFESRTPARIAHYSAVISGFMSASSRVEPWIYSSQAYRLPEFDRNQLDDWTASWVVLEPKGLLPKDGPPQNLLMQKASYFGLFEYEESIASAMGQLAAEYGEGGIPTLILFMVGEGEAENEEIAVQLDAAAGSDIFWQFFSLSIHHRSIFSRLKEFQREAPHVKNVSYYRGWEYSIETTPDFFVYRALVKKFSRWRRDRNLS